MSDAARRPWEDWVSWDPTPARHPWLTTDRLRRARAFSEHVWDTCNALELDPRANTYGFVGNLANYLYLRAVPLRKLGLSIDVIGHPMDRYVMSQPGWEEYDGEIPADAPDTAVLNGEGVELPYVAGITSLDPVESGLEGTESGTLASARNLDALLAAHPYLRVQDVVAFTRFMGYLPILDHLQSRDALLVTQATYLAYLSRRPYLAAQGGGDLWIDCSRADDLGQAQRQGFRYANAILASNPWTFAHARRFDMKNVVFLPFILDDEVYCPGPGSARSAWEEATGGSFFVLATSRHDLAYKGSDLAMEGFARFAARHSEARLVTIGWGDDQDAVRTHAREHGIADRVLTLPPAGKARLRDYLRSADCLVDQFTLGQYGATALEAMACGLPVVMRIERDEYDALSPAGAPPVLDASTGSEIAAQLTTLAIDRERRMSSSDESRSWFVAAHGSSRWADTYAALLAATAAGVRFDFGDSPLQEPLSEEERRYHAEGLRQAPAGGEAVEIPQPRIRSAADLAEAKDWLQAFARERGRGLRVLHVGNIANNAYLNASLLRRVGVEADVLSHDYYDPMATPEWETGERRPHWFVQGSFAACAAYLKARSERPWLARLFWVRLRLSRWVNSASALPHASRPWSILSWHARFRDFRYTLGGRAVYAAQWVSSLTRWMGRKSLRLLGFDVPEPGSVPDQPNALATFVAARTQTLVQAFTRAFPERPDRLVPSDLVPWTYGLEGWLELFERYDVVQCYAIDPIRPLLAAKRPYVAFEHGTLRTFTMENDPLHRTTALGYHESDHTFVTNGDCLPYAERLGIPSFSAMIHAIDVEQHERDYGGAPERIRERFRADVLLFCPVRHDWAVKGTQIQLAALPEIISRVQGRVVLATCAWGLQVPDSTALLEALGCAEHVVWLPPLNRRDLIIHTKAADVVLDQIALPHFGATAPQALAAGRPVVMSYRPESTEWIVPEPAPILPAFTPAEVVEAVLTALDPEWRAEFTPRAREWIRRYHHSDRLVADHLSIYRRLLSS